MAQNTSYILTSTAEYDFRDAKRWSNRRWGKQQTKQYFLDLEQGANYIAQNHASLASKDHLTGSTGLGIYAIREHYIVYLPVDTNIIIIVALIRQNRDVPAILETNHYRIRREVSEIKRNIENGNISILRQ